MPRVIWITGAGGFSGTHLAHYLRGLSEELELIGLDAVRRSGTVFDSFHVVDIRNEEAVGRLAEAKPPDRIFHLAGRMPPASEEELWCTNVGATLALLHALKGRAKKGLRILSIGSAAEYLPTSGTLTEKHPCGGTTPYGRTKWAQTVLALAAGPGTESARLCGSNLQSSWARPFSAPRGRVRFARNFRKDRRRQYRSGRLATKAGFCRYPRRGRRLLADSGTRPRR